MKVDIVEFVENEMVELNEITDDNTINEINDDLLL